MDSRDRLMLQCLGSFTAFCWLLTILGIVLALTVGPEPWAMVLGVGPWAILSTAAYAVFRSDIKKQ